MDIEVSSAGRPPRLSHVLRKDVARTDTFDEHSAEISYQGRDEVLGLKGVRTTDRSRLLAQRAKHTADNFGLAIEVYQTLFNQARELQITIKLEVLLGFDGSLSRTAQWLAVDCLARCVFGADSHLKTRTLWSPAPPIFSWLLVHGHNYLEPSTDYTDSFYIICVICGWLCLNVHRQIVNAFGSFHHGLRNRRMRVHRSSEFVRRRLQLHGNASFRDQFRRMWANDVHAQNLIVLLLTDDLYKAFFLADDAGLAGSGERKPPYLHVISLLPGPCLRKSY